MDAIVTAPRPASARIARGIAALAVAVAGVGLLATLAWALGTLATRPLDNVEGEILFEAARIRERLPLYVDPGVGAAYPGSTVPSRYLVLYVPVWPAVLSLVPAPATLIVARVVSTVAWFGTLVRAVAVAPRARQPLALFVALLFGGAFVLALHGTSGRPDAVAVAVAGAALLRSVRRGGADAVAAALFVLAFFLKPNAIGAAPGALLASVWLGKRLAPIAGAVGAAVGLGLVLTLATGGTIWIRHLLASTGQPPMLALWVEQISARGPFFLAPLAAILAGGVLAWRRDRGPGTLVATCALATSMAWCLLCLAKIGSASNYFLEPGIAATTLLACVTVPVPRTALLAIAAVVQAAWIAVASVRSAAEEIPAARTRADLVAHARALCGAPPGSLVASDEPGLEHMLNGRIFETPFQTANAVRAGRFDVAIWQRDLAQPEVACLLVSGDILERADVSPLHDRFGPEIRRLLRERFAFVASAGGYRLYRAR